MANPKTLKPFQKGPDPRRHIKQKSEKSWNRKWVEDYISWCKERKTSPEKKVLELFDRLDKMSEKHFPALEEFLKRVYGKVPDVLRMGAEEETVAKLEELYRTFREKPKKKK